MYYFHHHHYDLSLLYENEPWTCSTGSAAKSWRDWDIFSLKEALQWNSDTSI